MLYWMKSLWIQYFIEWNPIVFIVTFNGIYWMGSHYGHNGSKWNISEFNAVMNGISLQSMLCNGTWMSSMRYWKKSHWSLCYDVGPQWIWCCIEWNLTELDILLNGIQLYSLLHSTASHLIWISNPTEANVIIWDPS